MSHITIAQQGLEAVAAKKWAEAVTLLTTAIKASANPLWILARSKALIHEGSFESALDDASLAWEQAHARNQRPLMRDAHYRRAVAYYRMGKLADADCCCVYAMRLIKGAPAVEKEDPKAQLTDADGRWTATLEGAMEEARTDDFNKMSGAEGLGSAKAQATGAAPAQASEWRLASTLRMQILRAMDALPEDDPARKVTASQVPERTLPAKVEQEDHKPAAPQSAPQPSLPLRLQDFQNNTAVYLSIFSKGVDKEKLKVEFLPSTVHLNPVVYPNGEQKEFRLELWGQIDPEASKYVVTPNKVELTLVKKVPGKWSQVQKGEADTTEAKVQQPIQSFEAKKPSVDATTAVPSPKATEDRPSSSAKLNPPEPPKPTNSGPAYPSSSRAGAKNWDKIGADEGGDEEEGDVNLFFKKLYKGATPEQQRAMMKSFTESNGTSLSTDWDDVKSRTVETVPPEGVEEKKWG